MKETVRWPHRTGWLLKLVRLRRISQRAGRKPVPDEQYLARLRELVTAAGGAVPSAREVARLLSVGQDRARRLVAMMTELAENGATQ